MATITSGAANGAFGGHPKGLYYLAFTEAWERFSYYGMTALVMLYMIHMLLLPGHAEHVAGLAGFRHGLEAIFGPLSTQAFASQIYGLYTGFVYFTPMIGGWIADKWLGTRRTVVLGAILMSIGHFAMAFDASFLVALALLVIGTGCPKGNISAQVGRLYPPEAEAIRTRGYTIFSMGINVGAVTGPLLCGVLADVYGWHVGFAAAGLLMLAAMFTYLAGQKHLPPETEHRRGQAKASEPLTAQEWRTVLLLYLAMAITIFQTASYYGFFDAGIVWVDDHVDLDTALGHIPTIWFNSLDSFVSIVVTLPLVAFWKWQGSRGREPDDIAKIGIGAVICALSALVLAYAARLAGTGKVAPWLPLLGFSMTGIAFNYYWPTLLALISQSAPAKVNATMIGTAFLSNFVGNLIVGWIGTFYEPLGPFRFWLLDAAIAGGGALAVLLIGRQLSRALKPSPA